MDREQPQVIEAVHPAAAPPAGPVTPNCAKALCCTLTACGVGGFSYVLLRDNAHLLSPRWTAWTYGAAIVATLGLGLIAIIAWWRYGDAVQKASPWPYQWRVLKVGCVLAIIGLLPAGLAAASWANEKYRGAVELQYMSDFNMHWVPDRSEIYIRGAIGPGFSHELSELLAQEPAARRIVVTSPGGFIKEAFKVAFLLDMKHADIVARRTCNSACILILLAAHKRYADWDMTFGFHVPVDFLPDRDGNNALAPSVSVKVVEGFMTDHHVPGWIIADMERAGPNDVAAISAIQLAEQNLLTGLLDGDAPLTLNQAKWLWVQKRVGRRAWYSDSVPTVYRAIASQAPFVVDRYANTLYETGRPQDIGRFDYSASTMMSELAADAVAAADDSSLASYIESAHQQLAHLAMTSNWTACYNFLEAKAFVAPERFPTYVLLQHARAFVTLLRSANASKWRARGSSEGQELMGRWIMDEARAMVAADGILLPAGDRMAPGRCLIARETFGLLAAAPIEDARLALGWLGRYDRL
ncbi:MAG TPA: hypothetical protein VL574_08035 [Stellaceae bacterium]|nr:hypothetical protein [Stellaceae bacterium]